jgi:hypothetical protein
MLRFQWKFTLASFSSHGTIMARRDDLKKKLKAADRRRSRREPSQMGIAPRADEAGGTTVSDSASGNSVDVTGLCVEQIIKMNGRKAFRDTEVIHAIRACLGGGSPTSSESQLLKQRLDAIEARDDVSTRRFRDALEMLLRSATDHRVADDDMAFMRYLIVLAS